MNRPALVETIRVLRTIPNDMFDMGVYFRQTTCGTVACIAGHCAMDPWFEAQGFSAGLFSLAPTFNLKAGIDAIRAFYDLTDDQVHHIFYAPLLTPQAAIERINTFLFFDGIPTPADLRGDTL